MNRKKLLEKLDELTSKFVRNRDGKCILCGGHAGDIKGLQSHHWIVTRARSLKYRFDPRNCVSLCYACHIFKVHHNPTVALLDELKERAIIEGIVTEEEIEQIKSDCNVPYKMSLAEIEERIKTLQKAIDKQ
jgi:hypothetical protein